MTNIIAILRQVAQERPLQPAIVHTRAGVDHCMDFQSLAHASESGAAFLLQLGLRPGDAVLVFQPMSPELYQILLAIFRAGLVAMFLDPSAGSDHIAQCCAIQQPAAFVGSLKAHLLLLKSRALRRIPQRIVVGGRLPFCHSWASHHKFPPCVGLDLPDGQTPALITFTSGSTGQPKAAVRSHEFLIAQHQVLQRSIALKPGEIDLTTLPIFVLANLASGVTSVIPDANLQSPGSILADPVLQQIHRLGTTRTAASPAFLERLADTCEADGRNLATFTHIYTGGAPVFPSLLQRLQKLAPNATVTAVFGSTEAEPIAHIDLQQILPADFAAMNAGGGLIAGEPVPEIQLRILKDQWGTPLENLSTAQFHQLTLPVGKVGEIVVCGAHVLKSYFRNQGDRETKFRVADTVWHRTGDAGYLDPQNRLWLMGRCIARINDARGSLDPFAVECVARQFPAVRRCACLSHNAKRTLLIELNPGFPNIPEALPASLAWAQLDSIRQLPAIPVDKRHNAKIDYPRLRSLLQ